jgi:hypothetical protein
MTTQADFIAAAATITSAVSAAKLAAIGGGAAIALNPFNQVTDGNINYNLHTLLTSAAAALVAIGGGASPAIYQSQYAGWAANVQTAALMARASGNDLAAVALNQAAELLFNLLEAPLQVGGLTASLDIDFANNIAWNGGSVGGLPLLTTSRALAAYYPGFPLVSFPANMPRISYNGLFVEEPRTNLNLQSNTFGNAAWTVNNITIGASALAAPDPLSTASLFTETTGTLKKTLVPATAVPVTASGVYTASVLVAPGVGSRYFCFVVSDNGNVNNAAGLLFLPLTGQMIVAPTAYGTFSNVSGSAIPIGGGWYYVTLTMTVGAGTTAVSPRLELNNNTSIATNGQSNSYTGDGVSGLNFWNYQFEAGVFASSPILTTSAAVLRPGDNISILYSAPAAYSVYAKVGFWKGLTGSPARLIGTDAALAANLFQLDGPTTLGSWNGAAEVSTSLPSGAFTSGVHRCAFGGNAAGRAIVADGGNIVSDANPATAGWSHIAFGSDYGGSNYLNGYLQRFAIFNSLLSNPNLQALSTMG